MKLTKILIAALILIAFSFLYTYRLSEAFNLNSDHSRDLYEIAKISRGNFSLIGPMLSAGAAGPYYYYFFAPIFKLFSLNPNVFLYQNAIWFALGLSVTYLVLETHLGSKRSFLIVTCFGLAPFYLLSARNPGNGYTYLPLLLILTSLLLTYNQTLAKYPLITGLLVGLILNFHPFTILFLLPFCFFYCKKYLPILFGIFLTYLPLAAFEIKNHFILLNSFFHNHAVNLITGQDTDAFIPTGKISLLVQPLIIVSPLYYLLITVYYSLRSKTAKPALVLLFCYLLSTLLLVGRVDVHYLFPLAFGLVFVTIFLVTVSRQWYLSLLFLIIFSANFPAKLYANSERPISQFDQAVQFILSHHLVEKGDQFNVLDITGPDHLVPVGNEYRFFFFKNDLDPLPKEQYQISQKLLILSEVGDYPIKDLNIWETQQFGRNYLTHFTKYLSGPITIYIIKK